MKMRYEIWVASRWQETKEGPFHYADTRQALTETQVDNLRNELATELNIAIGKIRFQPLSQSDA